MHQTQGDDELLGLLSAAVGAVDADPVYDPDRVADVARLGLDDPAHAQPAVEAILKEVVADLGFPIGMVTGVLPGVQVLAGETGLDGWLAEARATPVEWSLCATVVRRDEAWVVSDMAAHPGTCDNPLTTVDGLRCYAGVPIRSPEGRAVGALCVLDTVARPVTDRDLARLEEAAAAATRRLAELAEPAE